MSHQVLANDLNPVSFVNSLMTFLTTPANQGLLELTRRPLMTLAISLSLAETYIDPGFTQVKKLRFHQTLTKFWPFQNSQPGSSVVSANDNQMDCVNEGRRVRSKSPLLGRAVDEVMSKETDETRFMSLPKSWQLASKLDSDHTWNSCNEHYTT